MAEEHDLGDLVHISAEAVGRPGQRRFRLRVMNGRAESASLWMEKAQLDALGDTIETVLQDEQFTYDPPPLDDRDPGFSEGGIELRVGRMSLGLDRDDQRIIIFASDGPTDEQSSLKVDVAFSFRRAWELRRQIAEVVAAGRPPCPLCGGPLDPEGHVCVRTNGYHPS
jgi:uncharacterized repeat protein (TIGR03847 family)